MKISLSDLTNVQVSDHDPNETSEGQESSGVVTSDGRDIGAALISGDYQCDDPGTKQLADFIAGLLKQNSAQDQEIPQ